MAETPEGTEPTTDTDAGENDPATEPEEIEVPADFDPVRALKTIKAQRESEAAAKAELKALKDEKAAAEKAEADKNKSLEEKLTEAEATLASLNLKIQEDRIRADFMKMAEDRGYEDPDLAYVAAKDAGILGTYASETETVGAHDFDKLEKRYPLLAAEAEDRNRLNTGDAARRSHGGRTVSVGQSFNDSIRGAMNR